MNHEGVKTEQELNTMEIQAEPEVVAHGIADAFKKQRAEASSDDSIENTDEDTPKTVETENNNAETNEADETDDGEMPELETPADIIDDSEPSTAEDTPKDEEEYITPRVLTPEESRERMRQREEEAKQRAKAVAELNQDFIEAKPSIKDFRFWEEEFEFNWNLLREYIHRAHGNTMADEARMEEPAFFTEDTGVLHETIEAQSGHFFHERARALRDAINNNADLTEAEKKRQLDKIDALWEQASRHMNFKNMTREDVRGYGSEYYERSRTLVHNGTIRALNDLNDLARSYKLKPFTPRNFWPSDGSRKEDPEPIKRRMRYDRDLVEEYYAIAFERELADEKKKASDQFSGYYGGADW